MMHVSPWLKVLHGQATMPQGIKKKESQVSEEREKEETGRGEGSRMRRVEATK